MDPYQVKHTTPSLSAYLFLRNTTGIGAKNLEAATIGLKNGLFSVQITLEDETVGMGRVVGDGGCFFQVVDIAVHTSHQGKGLGKVIMGEIKKWLDENVPKTGYVSLIADGQADKLYQQFGFAETAPASVGMFLEYL